MLSDDGAYQQDPTMMKEESETVILEDAISALFDWGHCQRLFFGPSFFLTCVVDGWGFHFYSCHSVHHF
jgi:hypothetical protein